MEPEKLAPINFENIEKIAAFIIMSDGLGVQEKMHELRQAGYDDSEIDIGAKMATQACLMVIFSRTFDTSAGYTWKKPSDPLA